MIREVQRFRAVAECGCETIIVVDEECVSAMTAGDPAERSIPVSLLARTIDGRACEYSGIDGSFTAVSSRTGVRRAYYRCDPAVGRTVNLPGSMNNPTEPYPV